MIVYMYVCMYVCMYVAFSRISSDTIIQLNFTGYCMSRLAQLFSRVQLFCDCNYENFENINTVNILLRNSSSVICSMQSFFQKLLKSESDILVATYVLAV